MNKIITLVALLMSCSLLASDGVERIKVKDIKKYVQTINPDSTCLDEYLKRRTQLIVQLSASPVIIAAGVGGGLAGGFGAFLVSTYLLDVPLSVPDDWVLSWAISTHAEIGLLIGSVAGAAATVANATITAINLRNTNLIIQALASEKMNLESDRVFILYARYLMKSKKGLSLEDFKTELMKMDEEGVLCDGSLVKQPKIKIGPKLKFKIPKLNGLVLGMDLRE